MSENGAGPGQRVLGLSLGWLLAAALAVAIGLVAVTQVGASLRGRGPLGNEVVRSELQERSAEVDPSLPQVERTIRDEFGEIDVACQGAFAIGLEVRPDEAQGWRTISFETDPDDDIDAVFAKGDRSIEIEVFCNLGEPTVSEIERSTLAE